MRAGAGRAIRVPAGVTGEAGRWEECCANEEEAFHVHAVHRRSRTSHYPCSGWAAGAGQSTSEPSFLILESVDLPDVRMIEGPEHLRFTPEARAPIGRYLTVTGLTRGRAVA